MVAVRAAPPLGPAAPRLRAEPARQGPARPAHRAGERQVAGRRRSRGRVCGGVLPLVLRGGGSVRAGVRRGPRWGTRTLRDPPPGGRGGTGHSVELPRGDDDAQGRPRPRGRVHCRPEARRGDTVDRAGGRDLWPRRGCQTGSSTSTPGPTPPGSSRSGWPTIESGNSPSPGRPGLAGSCSIKPPTGLSTPRWARRKCAASIVTEDADVRAAVAGAMAAKFRGGGQACTAANGFSFTRTSPRRSWRSSVPIEELLVGAASDGRPSVRSSVPVPSSG